MTDPKKIRTLPIRAYELLESEEGGVYLQGVGFSDCIIIYSGLSEETTQKFLSKMKQPFTLIKAGLTPLELK